MLYYLLRLWIRWSGTYFYSKTYFTGMDKLPNDRPLILACNHPTAFTEPAYMGGATLKARNFMLRGDMFSGGDFTAALLKSIKCIPIYRAQDGMANLKKNESILAYCHQLLSKGQNLYILSEGESKLEKRLRPIQKGTARMAFGAYEKHGRDDIAIIPIGINYMNANEFRSKVYADFGPPIPISEFFEAHEKNPRRAVKLLTDRIKSELSKRVIHVAKTEDDATADQLLLMLENNKNDAPFPLLTAKPSRLFHFIDFINQFNQLKAEKKQEIKEKLNQYNEKLIHYNISDSGIAQPKYYNWKVMLALIVGFVPFLVGYLATFIATRIPKSFADNKIKQPKFYGSVRIAMSAIFMFLTCLILLVIAAIWGNLWHVALVLLLPFFGHFSAVWRDYAIKWNEARKAKNVDTKTYIELKNSRNELLNVVRQSKESTIVEV